MVLSLNKHKMPSAEVRNFSASSVGGISRLRFELDSLSFLKSLVIYLRVRFELDSTTSTTAQVLGCLHGSVFKS
jgi:hypothetical protein